MAEQTCLNCKWAPKPWRYESSYFDYEDCEWPTPAAFSVIKKTHRRHPYHNCPTWTAKKDDKS